MKKRLRLLAGALGGLALGAGSAGAESLTIENQTDRPVVELYASNADAHVWEAEDEMLDGRVLAPGQSVTVELSRRFKIYDLKAVDDSGAERPYYGFNIRRISRLQLKPGEVNTLP